MWDTMMRKGPVVTGEGEGVGGKEGEIEDALEGILGPPHLCWV